MTSQSNNEVPLIATDAVLVSSQDMESGSEKVAGYDFNSGIDHHQLLKSFKYSGFQATNFGLAVEEIWKMIKCREEAIPEDKLDSCKLNGIKNNCNIFLGFTSNMASCGVRDTIRFLVQHKVNF